MPKTAMYEDDLAQAWKNEIGAAWELSFVKPVSPTTSMKKFSD
jgi:hypothetical protein